MGRAIGSVGLAAVSATAGCATTQQHRRATRAAHRPRQVASGRQRRDGPLGPVAVGVKRADLDQRLITVAADSAAVLDAFAAMGRLEGARIGLLRGVGRRGCGTVSACARGCFERERSGVVRHARQAVRPGSLLREGVPSCAVAEPAAPSGEAGTFDALRAVGGSPETASQGGRLFTQEGEFDEARHHHDCCRGLSEPGVDGPGDGRVDDRRPVHRSREHACGGGDHGAVDRPSPNGPVRVERSGEARRRCAPAVLRSTRNWSGISDRGDPSWDACAGAGCRCAGGAAFAIGTRPFSPHRRERRSRPAERQTVPARAPFSSASFTSGPCGRSLREPGTNDSAPRVRAAPTSSSSTRDDAFIPARTDARDPLGLDGALCRAPVALRT